MSFKGIDVRETTDRLVFRCSLKDSSGAKVTTGTTSLRLYELQSDGTLKTYDFDDNTFKTTTVTTETLALTHRTANNGATNTGIWTEDLATLTGFTRGNIYIAQITNTSASPESQEREFQFGDAEGDQSLFTYGSATGTPSTTSVPANVSSLSSSDDVYNNLAMVFITGANKGIVRKVVDYTGASKTFDFTGGAWPTAPSAGDVFILIGLIE